MAHRTTPSLSHYVFILWVILRKKFYDMCLIISDYIATIGARCWWRSLLRHCATSRKVAGSITDGVTEIFH